MGAPDLDFQVKAQLQQYPGWQIYLKDTQRDWDKDMGLEVSKTEDHVWQSVGATSASLSSGCGWQGRVSQSLSSRQPQAGSSQPLFIS